MQSNQQAAQGGSSSSYWQPEPQLVVYVSGSLGFMFSRVWLRVLDLRLSGRGIHLMHSNPKPRKRAPLNANISRSQVSPRTEASSSNRYSFQTLSPQLKPDLRHCQGSPSLKTSRSARFQYILYISQTPYPNPAPLTLSPTTSIPQTQKPLSPRTQTPKPVNPRPKTPTSQIPITPVLN